MTRIHGTVEESSEPAVDCLLLDRLAELDDEKLTEIFVDGQQAFAALYQRYVTRVFPTSLGGSDSDMRRILTADVFTRALAARSKCQTGKLWRPWLFGIPRNRALDHLRSLKRDSAEPVLQKSVIRDYVAEVSGGTEGALRVQIHRPLRTLRDQIEGTR